MSSKAKFQRSRNHVSLWPVRCTQKAVTRPVAQEGDPSEIRATGAILGPEKATLRGRSSTLRGLRVLPAGPAAVRGEPDLDSPK